MDTAKPARFRTWFDGNNISLEKKSAAHQAVYLCVIILHHINLLFSIISITFGLTSWILIPKWRQFKNYVFMNDIIATTINMIGFNLCAHYKFPNFVVVLLLLVPRIIISHWLLVTTLMFYWEAAKVYSNEINWKYLKANIFSWILPFIEVAIVFTVEEFADIRVIEIFNYVVNIVLLIVVFVLYVIVLSYIVRLTVTERGTRTDVCKKVLMASASGITSGFSTLLPILVMEMIHSDLVVYNVGLIMCNLTISAGHIAFLSLKQHRVLWADYRSRRRAISEVYQK